MSTDAEKEKAARRRRDKVQLSCNLCRRRKLRCNRVQPCSNCSSRGLASSCAFPENSNVPAAPAGADKAANFQDRVNQLEGLVVQLLQQQPPPAKHEQLCARCAEPLDDAHRQRETVSPAPTSTTTTSRSTHHLPDVGRLQIDSAKSAYVSSPHWSAVLNGLSELRTLWQTEEDAVGGDNDDDFFPGDQSNNQYYKSEPVDEDSPVPLPVAPSGHRRFQLLFGGHRAQTLDEILKIMPPRDHVDRLVLLYFNNNMLPLAAIHSDTFLAQYEEFWKSPHDTPILWIAMLFGIMSLASQTESAWAHYIRNPPPSGPAPHLPLSSPFPLQTPQFVDQVVACLILGEYTKGGTYAIEALIHYQIIEVSSSADLHADAWLVSGLITRLAYRMGYHRDPSHFPSINAFEGEMRRRSWITVHAVDTMLSGQMGLPRLIKAGSWDTEAPRNLLDADFGPASAVLPPGRPDSEVTPVMHLIAKHHLFVAVGAIADATMSVGPESPPWTLAREREMRDRIQAVYDGIPDRCKFHSMLSCIADTASDILHRIGAGALLQKGIIAIHWHRMMASSADDEAEQIREHCADEADRRHVRRSYALCVHAAMKVLGFHSIVDAESKPGGAMFPQRIQASSVIKHEFIMSTVLLCRHMYRVAVGPAGSPLLRIALEREDGEGDDGTGEDDSSALPEPHVIEAALRHSHGIWRRGVGVSAEARRISSILDALFARLSMSISPPSDIFTTATESSPFDGIDPGLALLDEFGLLHHLQDMSSPFSM